MEIRTGTNWGQPPYDPVGARSFQYAWFEIRDPTGNLTEFAITYTPSSSGVLSLWNITVTQENLNGLNTTVLYNQKLNTYDGVGGIVQQTGRYNVVFTDIFPTKTDPPSYIGIFKGKIVEQYPYISLLPWGIGIGALGAATTIFEFRNRKPKHTLKKRNSRLLGQKSTH